ncbi:MAG: HEAT repeat domain-containing protein [Pedosphaera sp.]|nr:HEAT repeat domain-containing protein [Pedosphaera sp.]
MPTDAVLLALDNPAVREFAAVQLAGFKHQAKPGIPALLKALNDKDARVSRRAALAIQDIDDDEIKRLDIKAPFFE